MIILGVNAYHGDSSACLILDGQLIAAVEEERFRRIKHWAGFPTEAIRYCLREADVQLTDVDHIAVSRNPNAHLHRKILFMLGKRPSFSFIRDRLANMGKVKDLRQVIAEQMDVNKNDLKAQFHNVEHHRAHMASAFFVSPFEEAAVLSIDGFGDFVSTMWGYGKGNQLEVFDWVEFPHSLGLFYTAITQYLGFTRYGDEFKVMGLASYGEPEYLDEMREIVQLRKQGKFELNLDYFRHHAEGIEMSWEGGEPTLEQVYSDTLIKRLGPARHKDEKLTLRHKNIACSMQMMEEEAIFHVINHLAELTPQTPLCLAGGVGFNSVANGKIHERTPIHEFYMQAAVGDAGTALGAAYYVYHQILKYPREFVMEHAFWGPGYSDTEIEATLKTNGIGDYERYDEEALVHTVAEAIHDGKVVGWFQGRAEWGPRALGNRSILADPRKAEMKDILNSRIKHREPFRPFAPSILVEAVGDYFEHTHPVPFMLQVYRVKPEKRSVIPAVTHVDGTGRLQTIDQKTNPLYWKLIKAFGELTGVPVVLNTSFNENEPIVCSPQEGIDCFLRTQMDVLAIGPYIVCKNSDDPS